MRALVTLVGILSIFGFGASAQTTDRPQSGQMCLLKVSGMHCGACAAQVEKTAKKIDGVTSVRASQPKGSAEIAYDPAKTSPEAIAKIITEKTPFTAEVAKPDPKK